MSDAKLQRTLLRFNAKITSGEYYEAHQTLRTITNRYVKSKQYSDAIALLYQGSSVLSNKKEYASASDLITYLIQVYEEANIKIESSSDINKIKLIELINLLPDTDPSLPDLSKQAINWSKTNDNKFGDCNLHHVFGVKFLNSIKLSPLSEDEKYKLFNFAELHLILGTYESLPVYINFLWDWYKQSSKDVKDPGVLLSRAIINYSYLKNIKFVKESLNIFMKNLVQYNTNYESIDGLYFYQEYQLINFLQLLVITLNKETTSGEKFLKLYQQYKAVLTQYELNASIEYLGRFYFNLNLGSSSAGVNPLASLMGGLFK